MGKTLKEQVMEILVSYTGAEWHIDSLEVAIDPQVEYMVAAKVMYKGYKHRKLLEEIHFLINLEEGEDSVEEVEYTEWPPTSGSIGFFVTTLYH